MLLCHRDDGVLMWEPDLPGIESLTKQPSGVQGPETVGSAHYDQWHLHILVGTVRQELFKNPEAKLELNVLVDHSKELGMV